MHKGLKKVCLFLLPIIVAIVAFEIGLRNIPNAYRYKNDYLEKNKGDIEVLILGNSHTYYGVDPVYLTKNAFNAAHISQRYDYDIKILDKFLEGMKNLQYVVISYSLQSLFDEGLDNSFINKNYVIYYGLENEYSWKHSLELFALPVKANLKRLISYHINGSIDHSSTPLGFGEDYLLANQQDLELTSISAIKRHNYQSSFIVENQQALDYLIEKIEEKGIKIILLSAPLSKYYLKMVHQDFIEMVQNEGLAYDRDNELIYYLNWTEHENFSDEDFYDGDHLNEDGAKKLTLLLNDYLMDIE